jgi:hypothetical protein
LKLPLLFSLFLEASDKGLHYFLLDIGEKLPHLLHTNFTIDARRRRKLFIPYEVQLTRAKVLYSQLGL